MYKIVFTVHSVKLFEWYNEKIGAPLLKGIAYNLTVTLLFGDT